MFIRHLGEPTQSDADGIIISHPFSTLRNASDFNLQVFDTMGYGSFVDAYRTIDPIIKFIEEQFTKTRKFLRPAFADAKTLGNMMSSSDAHTHVDVVLYGIFHRLKPLDIEWLKKLSGLVPIVPILLKSDTLNSTQVFKLKETMIREMMQNQISV